MPNLISSKGGRLAILVLAFGAVGPMAIAQDSTQNAGAGSQQSATAGSQAAALAASAPAGSVAVGSVVVGGSAIVGGSTVIEGGAAMSQVAQKAQGFGTGKLEVDRQIIVAPQTAPQVPHDAVPLKPKG